MRLQTIWSIPSMSMMERLRRTVDWGAMTSVRFLPPRVRYWTTIIEVAKATKTSPHVPATPLDEIIKNLSGGPK